MDCVPYQLVDYSPEFYEALIDLINRGYALLGYSGLELDGLDSDLKDIENNFSCFKIVLDGDKLIGSVALKIKGVESEIKRVFVDQNYQGQGIGKKLSLWAFDYARDQGASIMHIWSGTHCKTAHLLYEALGAENTGKERFIGGNDNISEYYFKKILNVE